MRENLLQGILPYVPACRGYHETRARTVGATSFWRMPGAFYTGRLFIGPAGALLDVARFHRAALLAMLCRKGGRQTRLDVVS